MRGLIIWLLLCGTAWGQRESVAKVVCPDGSSGSCVIVSREARSPEGYTGIAVTAWHVVVDGSENSYPNLKVEYKSGRTCSNCYVVSFDKESDIALLRVWMPPEAVPVKIADTLNVDDEVAVYGYAYGEFESHKGRHLRKLDNWRMHDMTCMPGQSGGGVFKGQELVGVVSGGWFWIGGLKRRATWPTRSCGFAKIKEMLKREEPTADGISK